MISSYTDDASKSIEGVNCFFLPIKIFWRREGGKEGGRGGRRVTLAGWTIFFHVNTSSRPPEMRELNRKCVRRPYVKETTVQFCLYFFQCAHAFLCILRSAEKLVPSQCYLGHQNFLIGLLFQK